MKKSVSILLVFLLLMSLSLPALAAPSPAQTPVPLVNADGTIVMDENPNMFLSYAGGIALFAVIIFSIWVKVRAMQNGAGGRSRYGR